MPHLLIDFLESLIADNQPSVEIMRWDCLLYLVGNHQYQIINLYQSLYDVLLREIKKVRDDSNSRNFFNCERTLVFLVICQKLMRQVDINTIIVAKYMKALAQIFTYGNLKSQIQVALLIFNVLKGNKNIWNFIKKPQSWDDQFE